jgi:hypothetical protein
VVSKNPFFKDGKLKREPRPAPKVKPFKHGAKEVIRKGPSKAKADAGKKRFGKTEVHHYHHKVD